MMNKLCLGFGAGIIIMILYAVFSTLIVFGAFDKHYSGEELIGHYKAHLKEFSELIVYYESIVPNDKEIDVEFENDKKLFRFGVISIDTLLKSRTPTYFESDLAIVEDLPGELLEQINWSKNEFSVLKEKLDGVDCISIASGSPIEIGFQRSGLGMYSYLVFDFDSQSELLKVHTKRDDLHFFMDNVAWKYDGGALD